MLRRPNYRGFTLIELLVTIVIIGIIVSFAVLSIGDNQSERERRVVAQLATLIELGKETALFNAEEIAIYFWEYGYSFHRQGEKEWEIIEDDVQFRTREIPEDMIIHLYLEGLKVKLPILPKKKPKPQVFILSSGEVTAFEVRIGIGRNPEMKLTSDVLGNLEMAHLDD